MSLALSCKAMHRLVTTADARTWQQAAQRVVPWLTSLPASIPAVRAVLSRQASASRNILQGACAKLGAHRQELQDLEQLTTSFSPVGRLVAYAHRKESGACALTLMEIAGGTSIPVLVRQHVSLGSMAWQSGSSDLYVLLQDCQELGFFGALHVHVYDSQGREVSVWSPTLQPNPMYPWLEVSWSSDRNQLLVGLGSFLLHDCCFLDIT